MGNYANLPLVWSPLYSFFAPHPQYSDIACSCIYELFYGQGPLRMAERHYIALMAAASTRCDFLVNLHMREFEREGGDLKWLKGLQSVTESKFNAMDVLVTYISHQPWRVNAKVLDAIIRDGHGVMWSLSHLVHAACIITTTNSLCSFVLSLGNVEPIGTPADGLEDELASRCEWLGRERKKRKRRERRRLEAEQRKRSSQEVKTDDEENNTDDSESETRTLLERMAGIRREAKEARDRVDEAAEHRRSTNFFELASEGVRETYRGRGTGHSARKAAVEARKVAEEKAKAEAKLIQDASVTDENTSDTPVFTKCEKFAYTDFQDRDDDSKTFKIHEFCWEQHGFSMIDDIYPQFAKLLDCKFREMQSLTYNTMGHFKNVDTSEYRTSIWHYIQALFGIRHDDYDYSQVNEMLSRPMKTFIKNTTCFPDRMTAELRKSVMEDFSLSEKLHVLLLCIEARSQTSILYFTRALTNYYVLIHRGRQ